MGTNIPAYYRVPNSSPWDDFFFDDEYMAKCHTAQTLSNRSLDTCPGSAYFKYQQKFPIVFMTVKSEVHAMHTKVPFPCMCGELEYPKVWRMQAHIQDFSWGGAYLNNRDQIFLLGAGRRTSHGSASVFCYSGTPLIRPPTGQNKVVVLTGWSYYRGRVIFRSKHVNS